MLLILVKESIKRRSLQPDGLRDERRKEQANIAHPAHILLVRGSELWEHI